MNTQVQPEQIQQQQSQQPVQSKQPKRQRRQRKKNKNTITAAADKQPEITAEARLRLHTKRYADQIIMNNYDSPIDSDGQRFLLTVFAPKNVDKQSLRLAGWLKDLAPSHELHRAFYPKNPKVEPISGEQFIAR